MSTYQEIKGLKIKYLSADTSGDRAKEGEVFYNSTSFAVKTFVTASAWHSSGSLNTSRQELNGAGTVTAGLAMGGYTTTTLANTEEYNGSGWATGEDMPAVKHAAASGGVQTAAFIAGGYPDPGGNVNTYEYDGTDWAAGGDLNTSRRGFTGSGTLTAGLAIGGFSDSISSGAPLTNVEEYDGSSWTNGGALPAGNGNIGAAGTQTATVAFGGYLGPPGNTTNSYHYNGSSWTSGGSLNTARNSLGGSGIQTSAMGFGGGSPASNATELYNGSSWTTSSNMGTARFSFGSAQNTTSNETGLAFGGGPPHTAVTEEFTTSLSATTAGAWSSGGNHPQNIRGGGSAGTQTAAWYVGGLQYPSDTKNRTDEYNGSSWTNVNNLPADYFNGNACGTLTAGLIFGSNAGYGAEEQVYEYDGTDWTAGGSLPDIGPAYGSAGGGGTQTAAVACGGYGDPPPGISTVLEYNGSSWSANPNSLPTGNYNQAGDGTATALWLAGGYLSSTATLHFDGTSFTTSGSMATARPSACGAGYGTQTNAIVAGGEASGTSTQGEQYNGTIWVTAPSMSQGRKYGLGASRSAGSQTGFICGGATPPNPNTNATEEFTPETVAVRSAKTFDFD